MCLILKKNLISIAALLALVAGCQRDYLPETQKLSPAPILEDQAMAHRHWDTMVVQYSNGASIAFPTLYPYVPRTNTPEVEQIFTGPGLFLGQTLALPVTMFITPPWQETIYRGIYTPPTYTAVPVVAPDAETLHPAYKSVRTMRVEQDSRR